MIIPAAVTRSIAFTQRAANSEERNLNTLSTTSQHLKQTALDIDVENGKGMPRMGSIDGSCINQQISCPVESKAGGMNNT